MVEGRDTKRFRSGDNKKKLVDYIEKGDAKKTNAIGEGEGFLKIQKRSYLHEEVDFMRLLSQDS